MIRHRAFDEIGITDSIYCSIDPVTITALALAGTSAIAGGALASGMSSGGGSTAPAATPSAPPSAPAPQMQPATTRPKPKSNTPSFIGGSAVPENSAFGAKSLLGQ